MNANKTFVVVDLETTGQSVAKGGRIIQIGMTFIKNRRIIDHFESFVNPAQPIDRNIQQLTHISQKEVKNAPYFEEIAPVIQNLLTDTVIIAHNVNFDYPYLNDEFARTGFPELTNAAIDTVQLAQILLPTAPGYRLLDLTTYLNITLNNAHRANADAHATALLFLSLWQRAEQLPTLVLQQLQNGNWPLLRQTQAFLQLIKAKSKRSDIEFFSQLAVKKPTPVIESGPQKLPVYPTTAQDKAAQFGHWLTPKEAQNELMNRVNVFISKRADGILTMLTAPKIGKTLGYLVPLLLNAASKPLMLLTNDESLQIQQRELVQKIAKLLDIRVQVATLYDASDYIDVAIFNQLCQRTEDTAQVQFFKARVLVWLTQTNTGLLHEIQVGASNIPLIDEIRSDASGLFFKRAQATVDASDVLIMNFETYFNQANTLLTARHLKKWPVVTMETPNQFVSDLEAFYHVSIDLKDLQNSLKSIVNQEIVGLTHKQRLFIKQSVGEALKLIRQIYQSQHTVTNLKRIERLLIIISRLSEVLQISGHSSLPREWQSVKQQLAKVRRLQQQTVIENQIDETLVNDQKAIIYHYRVPTTYAYHNMFINHIHKLLVISEYLDTKISEFLRDTPENMTVERDFIHNDTQAISLVQLGKTSPILHLQAMTQKNIGEIVVIVPDIERVNHWYQKLRHVITTEYNLVAEGITGSLEKIQRQSHSEQPNIVILTPKVLTTMWLRDQELPRIVVVPERSVWQPVSRLALVLTEMQRHPAALLVTQLNAMQRHRFKSQLKIISNLNHKQNLITQYDHILNDF